MPSPEVVRTFSRNKGASKLFGPTHHALGTWSLLTQPDKGDKENPDELLLATRRYTRRAHSKSKAFSESILVFSYFRYFSYAGIICPHLTVNFLRVDFALHSS